MKIYIIRHGETDANANGLMQGWSDGELNEFGIMLAEETGKKLKGIKFDAAYSSPLVRARKTAEIIIKETESNCPLYIDDRLKEINMGDYEGRNFKQERLSGVKEFLVNPLETDLFPGGETVLDCVQRTQLFLKELVLKEYETVLVSTHGCALRCMLNFLYDENSNFWHDQVPLNCCINIVEAEDGEIKLTGDDLILYDKSLCIDRYTVDDCR
ncbi:MAG: histidine phosphatase family protein [Lachnospiraceae bacterium]|nr:histidine phosphatase family protein [Lachnospiraceae bacterium]